MTSTDRVIKGVKTKHKTITLILTLIIDSKKYYWREYMKSKYKLHIYKDKKGEFRWKLVARNKRIVADSGEGYKRVSTMMKTIQHLFYDQISTGLIIIDYYNK